MKKLILIIGAIIFITSCSSRLYKIKELNLDRPGIHSKTYHLNEFKVYILGLCENTALDNKDKRFFNCPRNYFARKRKDTLKIEEVYLLYHQQLNLGLYLTTFSHTNLKDSTGFLNDEKIYKNKIVLNEIEYGYIGQIDTTSNWIHFPSQEKNPDVILHYDRNLFPDKILINEANIATAENKFSIDEKINLTRVFREPLAYIQNNYRLVFYEKSAGKGNLHLPDCFNIISRRGRVELAFGCAGKDRLFFKIPNSKVRYHPNFYLIPH